MTTSVRVTGLVEAKALIAGIGERMPDIVLLTEINAAEKSKAAEEQEIRNTFDRPTPLIENGMRITIDKNRKLVGLGWKDVYGKNEPTVEHRGNLYADAVSRTLIPQIDGTQRVAKPSERQLRAKGLLGASEFLVPSRTAPLDRYGNIPGSTMSKIIADLQAYTYSGSSRNTKDPNKMKYIWGKVGNARGIFQVQGGVGRLLGGNTRGNWSLIFLVVNRAPNYRQRFKFYETATDSFKAIWKGEFERVYEREISKIKR
jgi:hypothetical protein